MKTISLMAVGLVYLFLFLPMAVLVVLSFNSAAHGAKWQGFTFDWYMQLFKNDAILQALSNSLEIATAATLLSALLGLCVGITVVRVSGTKRGNILTQLTMLPIILPDIVIGLSLLCFFVWLFVPLGKLSVIIAHTAFGTAYVTSLVRARLVALDPMLEDAAADLGAGPWRILLKITLPQLWPALLSGMLMVFTLSFDDFCIAFFTAGVGATTLPLKIYSMLKFGVTPEVNALSALILCVSLVLVSLAFWRQKQPVSKQTGRKK